MNDHRRIESEGAWCRYLVLLLDAALNTLHNGGGYCIPGWRHKLLYSMQKVIPRFIGLRIMAKQMRF